jgi:hypothetical protein
MAGVAVAQFLHRWPTTTPVVVYYNGGGALPQNARVPLQSAALVPLPYRSLQH